MKEEIFVIKENTKGEFRIPIFYLFKNMQIYIY